MKNIFTYTRSGTMLKGLAKDSLIAFNIFIIFLLLFESRYAVPQWLQPIGRMHPLLLHFPIVLLIIGMLMEFFRFSKNNIRQEFYQLFNTYILFSGVLLSGITVIMGLFLSKEEGYEERILILHKWTGVAIFFTGSLIFWLRNTKWYTPVIAKAGAVVALCAVLGAGHFGAAITHGDNFILDPLAATYVKENIVLEDARVFDHMVKPILDYKCVSCHNSEKVKGALMLTDAESILKGGKSGNLFVPGNPQVSLLLKRIHLPEEDKKHMPPKGKLQLTDEEISTIQLWIKANADFKLKAIDLPPTDSLHILAAAQFRPLKSREENYTFDAADEDLVKKLNNEYRVISEIAKGSPSLAVNFFNKSFYTSGTLNDLSGIKNQIVQLSLNKMPVKDQDLKTISQFINLRKLDLNFTDITGQGLKFLEPLQNLQHLSVSGTSMTLNTLKENIHELKSLQQLAVWNCGLSEEDIVQLKKSNTQLVVLQGFTDDGKNPLKLHPPLVVNNMLVFADSILLELKHTIRGVQIRYTIDGTAPDSVNSPLFEKYILLNKNTTIRATAYKKGWLTSDTTIFNVFRSQYEPDSATLLTRQYMPHLDRSIKTLSDGILGTPDKNEKWVGFAPYDLRAVYKFNTPKMLSSVALHIMEEEPGWIYPPAVIEIWGGDHEDHLKLLGKSTYSMPLKGSKIRFRNLVTEFKPLHVSCIRVVATTIKAMPAFSTGKGQPPMMMFDEIFIN